MGRSSRQNENCGPEKPYSVTPTDESFVPLVGGGGEGLGEAQALAQRDYPADKVCFLHTCKLSNEPKFKKQETAVLIHLIIAIPPQKNISTRATASYRPSSVEAASAFAAAAVSFRFSLTENAVSSPQATL